MVLLFSLPTMAQSSIFLFGRAFCAFNASNTGVFLGRSLSASTLNQAQHACRNPHRTVGAFARNFADKSDDSSLWGSFTSKFMPRYACSK